MGAFEIVIWEMGLVYITRKQLLFSEIMVTDMWKRESFAALVLLSAEETERNGEREKEMEETDWVVFRF